MQTLAAGEEDAVGQVSSGLQAESGKVAADTLYMLGMLVKKTMDDMCSQPPSNCDLEAN